MGSQNNIAAAKVAGLAKSLELSSSQYSTAVALLFVGYILMQIPSNVFLAHIRPSLYLPVCMAVWGVLSLCTGLVHNAAGLYTTRFFLGFVEAAFYRELPHNPQLVPPPPSLDAPEKRHQSSDPFSRVRLDGGKISQD